MEKKLTDEEIVKALAYCNNPDKEKGCVPCPYSRKTKNDIRCYMRKMHNDLLDLIHRLKDENERLKDENIEERDIHFKNLCGYKDEIARLQKQVDELTERYLEESKERCEFEQKYKKIQHAHNIGLGAQRSHWEKKVQQAVKDTAKEIIRWIKLNGLLEYGGYVIHDSTIEQICKKYGVEVE